MGQGIHQVPWPYPGPTQGKAGVYWGSFIICNFVYLQRELHLFLIIIQVQVDKVGNFAWKNSLSL